MRSWIALLFATGCALDGGDGVELGRIDYFGDGPEIDVPAAARVDSTVTVRVITFGGGCIDHVRTEVTQRADHVAIYPLDSMPPEGAVCTLELRKLEHTATFSFASPGTKAVEVHGRRVSNRVDETISVSFSIDVAP